MPSRDIGALFHYVGGAEPGSEAAGERSFVVPENVPAGWWPRAGAFIIDALLTTGVEVAIEAPLRLSQFTQHHVAQDRQMLALGINAVVVAVYYSLVMRLTNGRTVGKYALGLRVLTMSAQGMTVPVVLMREVIAKELAWGLILLDHLVVLGPATLVLIINYLWPLGQRQNRALHDLFAGTRVVREFR